ncbi:MAG: hypothetical protein AAFY66_14360, partial [Pseudomonadota bacterium]
MFAGGGIGPFARRALAPGRSGKPDIEAATRSILDVAADLSQNLSREAEAVCRQYLSNGRRHGNYWVVGDVKNTPGRSLYVRLTGPTG